tara:strand:- start:64 stop:357 length:294 start_codon:yes stop_codon:yes gene_type:complete
MFQWKYRCPKIVTIEYIVFASLIRQLHQPQFGGCELSQKKVIAVELNTHKKLLEIGRKGETFDQVINRVMDSEKGQQREIIRLELEIERLNGVKEEA